ncbi:MAG TPA: exodeoxyribonuclease V subunit gamma [Burkholderiales bacterium]
MLYVHQSNRLERLSERLGEIIATPLAHPLAPEVIVVPNAGVGRWLSLALAGQLGVSANLRLRFPAEFVWDVARAALPDVPARSTFDPDLLVWRVFAALGSRPRDAAFRQIEAYLADGDDVRRYELAERIAQVFDQYLVYRPELIEAWEEGEDDHWQARLWRELVAEGDRRHWARLQKELLAALARDDAPAARLPQRVSLFALSALSPGYLAIVAALARRADVHLYVVNPCRQYWGDIVSARRLAAAGADGALVYAETGNALLASLGQQGRDFIDMVIELGPIEEDLYVEPGEDTLLQRIQSDILDLRNTGAPDGDPQRYAPPVAIAERRSLQVHVCHSPMREVEVLHDQLLALIEETGVRPSDIVVMTPDIEAYAPYIEAIFATAPPERSIPFSIADRRLPAESAVVAAFFGLLALPRGRFDANSVLALLEAEAVQRRFGFTDADLPLVREWVRESRIRWGIDASTREALGLPAFSENSWTHGLDRLMLGYALPVKGSALFAGILPCDDIEGARAQTLGRLHAFTARLFAFCDELRTPKPLAEWARTLARALELFFAPSEAEEGELQAIRQALAGLEEAAGIAHLRDAVTLDLVRHHLEQSIEFPRAAGRFLTGGVTFCALVPMRSLPFRVVCLIGMNDGSFPRTQTPPSFDLIAQSFRRGDRSRRADDRYLFLETLLAARDVLYLSYVGQSIRDNAPLPPSVLVSELLDYVRQAFRPTDGKGDVVEEIVTRHPLQAFSPRYFEPGGRLFSYSEELARASGAAASERRDPGPFLERLPEPAPEWRTVTLERLVRFFRNPARYLLRERLGVVLEESEGLIDTREPMALDWAGRQEVREHLLDAELSGEGAEAAIPALRAGGLLPIGEIGRVLVEQELATVRGMTKRLQELRRGPPRPPVEVDVVLGDMRLKGALGELWPPGRVHYQLRTLRAGDLLDAWIHHLCLNLARPEGVAPTTWAISHGARIEFLPVAEAKDHLHRLVALYWEGLQRPLRFFPRSAYAYAAAENGPRMEAARKEWEPNAFNGSFRAEKDDPYYDLVFRGEDPLDGEFERLAEEIFGPVLSHRKEDDGR